MLEKIRGEIRWLEPTQQSLGVKRAPGWLFEPDQQEAQSQTGGADPLVGGQCFAEQEVTEQDGDQQFTQPEDGGLHPADVLDAEEKHQP